MGKTLKELGVNVGDVVCHSIVGVLETVDLIDPDDGWVHFYGGSIYTYEIGRVWSLVSRAAPPIDLTAITTPFGLLDEATQKALKDDGGPYEFYDGDGKWWGGMAMSFLPSLAYRKKPAPEVETVVLYWNHTDGVGVDRLDRDDTHLITMTFTNGVVDPVAKVEALK